MADNKSAPGIGKGLPDIGALYIKQTTPRSDGLLPGAIDLLGELSFANQFKVSLHLTNGRRGDSQLMNWLDAAGITSSKYDNAKYDFFCAEAVLPGVTFQLAEELGSRQGVIEKFPTRKLYQDFSITLYVDNEYNNIRLFEEWMNYINPIYVPGEGELQASRGGQGNAKDSQSFFRLKYPNTYKRIISVSKFERNFNTERGKGIKQPDTLTYRMIDAFPTNIAAIPLTYEGSVITKTIITFSYSRHIIEKFTPSKT
jgi:hypothetical protein